MSHRRERRMGAVALSQRALMHHRTHQWVQEAQRLLGQIEQPCRQRRREVVDPSRLVHDPGRRKHLREAVSVAERGEQQQGEGVSGESGQARRERRLQPRGERQPGRRRRADLDRGRELDQGQRVAFGCLQYPLPRGAPKRGSNLLEQPHLQARAAGRQWRAAPAAPTSRYPPHPESRRNRHPDAGFRAKHRDGRAPTYARTTPGSGQHCSRRRLPVASRISHGRT